MQNAAMALLSKDQYYLLLARRAKTIAENTNYSAEEDSAVSAYNDKLTLQILDVKAGTFEYDGDSSLAVWAVIAAISAAIF